MRFMLYCQYFVTNLLNFFFQKRGFENHFDMSLPCACPEQSFLKYNLQSNKMMWLVKSMLPPRKSPNHRWYHASQLSMLTNFCSVWFGSEKAKNVETLQTPDTKHHFQGHVTLEYKNSNMLKSSHIGRISIAIGIARRGEVNLHSAQLR